MVRCLHCTSQKTWKDGLRKTRQGEVQRYVCRECGYRFSDKTHIEPSNYGSTCQICVSPERKAKNLTTVEPLREGLAGATKDDKELILEYAWHIKRRGLAPSTITQRVYRLKRLVKEGATLTEPESVTTVLALSNWTESNKQVFIVTYKSFAKTFGLQWIPPKTRVARKLPFIPPEAEIDQLIAGCGPKTATFLQVLKDTAARGCEASKLRWTDIDDKSCTIRINNPVKGSLARMVKVSGKTIAMVLGLPRNGEYIFNPKTDTLRKGFTKQRNRIARTLQNPRLKEIHLHTLRHWKATMEYHRTKDILYVKQLLGHRKLENTEIYTHLISFESDEWHVAHAKNLDEEDKLLEAGFEYVRFSDADRVAIYRKRK